MQSITQYTIYLLVVNVEKRLTANVRNIYEFY